MTVETKKSIPENHTTDGSSEVDHTINPSNDFLVQDLVRDINTFPQLKHVALIIWAEGGGGHKSYMRALRWKLEAEDKQVVDVCIQDWLGRSSKLGTKLFDLAIARGYNSICEFLVGMQPILDNSKGVVDNFTQWFETPQLAQDRHTGSDLETEAKQVSQEDAQVLERYLTEVHVCQPLSIPAIAQVISNKNNERAERNKREGALQEGIGLHIHLTDFPSENCAYRRPVEKLLANLGSYHGDISIFLPGKKGRLLKNYKKNLQKILKAKEVKNISIIEPKGKCASIHIKHLGGTFRFFERNPGEYFIDKSFKEEINSSPFTNGVNGGRQIVLTTGSQGNPKLIKDYVQNVIRTNKSQHWIIFAGKSSDRAVMQLKGLFNTEKKSWYNPSKSYFKTTYSPWVLTFIIAMISACIYGVTFWVVPTLAAIVITNIVNLGALIISGFIAIAKFLHLYGAGSAVSVIWNYAIALATIFLMTTLFISILQCCIRFVQDRFGSDSLLSDAKVREKIASSTSESYNVGEAKDQKEIHTFVLGTETSKQQFTIVPFIKQKYIVQAWNSADQLIVSAGGQSIAEAVAYLSVNPSALQKGKTLCVEGSTCFAWQNPANGNPMVAEHLLNDDDDIEVIRDFKPTPAAILNMMKGKSQQAALEHKTAERAARDVVDEGSVSLGGA